MFEHVWIMEQMEAYLAGGLDAAEVERFEEHVRACASCAEAVAESRQLDSRLSTLFHDVHPSADLEDRTILALRNECIGIPLTLLTGWRKRVLVAAALAVAVSGGGYIGTHLKNLPMPGDQLSWRTGSRVAATPQSPQDERGSLLTALPEGLEAGKDLSNEDLGLEQFGLKSSIESPLESIDRLEKQSVGAVVTQERLGSKDSPSSTATGRFSVAPDSFFMEREATQKLGALVNKGADGVFQPNYANPDYKLPAIQDGEGQFKPSLSVSSATNTDSRGDHQNGRSEAGAVDRTPSSDAGLVPRLPASSGGRLGDSGKDNLFRLGENAADGKRPPISLPVSDPGSVQEPVAPAIPPVAPVTVAGSRNIVIRSGDIEFVIDSFDAASATVTKLVNGIKGAFIATTNSDKMVNGKVKGSLTVRVPPEQLDGLILDLRKELGKVGELKGIRVGSQEITKQYTDLESRLKAARTMELRLLQIIKDGKGEIKQLLEAEKELGVWRTRIEEIEGELRYYSNHVSLSTLIITLTEKEFRAAADIRESERVKAGLEVEDVEKIHQQLLALVMQLKGRVTKSEMKQLSAGQFSASLHFDVAPDVSGQVRDRLRQLGHLARLEIDRVQRPEGAVIKDARVERGDTEFILEIYNLANIEPREVVSLHVAVIDVPAAFRSLRESTDAVAGRVLKAQLNEQDSQNISAQFEFEVSRAKESDAKAAIDSLGEVVARQVARASEAANVTDAKVRHNITIVSASQLKPREKTAIGLEVPDVDQSVVLFNAQVDAVKGKLSDSQFTRDRSGHLTARLIYIVPQAAAPGLVEQFKKAGAVRLFQSARDPQASEGKFATARLEVSLTNAERIVSADDGLWPQIHRGLSNSASVLLFTVSWVIVGLCVVVPWAILIAVAIRLFRWFYRANRPAMTP